MPMGVASMSFTCRIPSASMESTCSGSFFPFIRACRAGIRFYSMRFVLPEPDTPVTEVSFPLGISASNDFTVWIGPVERQIRPSENNCSDVLFATSGCLLHLPRISGEILEELSEDLEEPERNGPIWESLFLQISSTVPSAITCPPSAPAPEPISMIQSASERI